MKKVLSALNSEKTFESFAQALSGEKQAAACGLWGSSKALFVSALFSREAFRVLGVVTVTLNEAEEFLEDLALLGVPRENLLLYPPWESRGRTGSQADANLLSARIRTLRSLTLRENRWVLVAPAFALVQGAPSPEELNRKSLTLHAGQRVNREELASTFVGAEYVRAPMVEVPGEFSIRGDIIDVYSHHEADPVRIELHDDEVESIRFFDPFSQRSRRTLPEVELLPVPPSLFMPRDGEGEGISAYLPGESLLLQVDPGEMDSRIEDLFRSNEAARKAFASLESGWGRLPVAGLCTFAAPPRFRSFSFQVSSVESKGKDIQSALEALEILGREHEEVFLFCTSQGEADRFRELLIEKGFLHEGWLRFRTGRLESGFRFPVLEKAFVCHHELFRQVPQRRAALRLRRGRPIESLLELEEGDTVVHASHGIGKFLRMEKHERDGKLQEFLVIEYRDGAKLYVPVSKIDLVQRYLGGREGTPLLDRLGGRGWQRRKKVVESAVRDLASELLELQAIRNTRRGIAFPKDTEWQHEFESAFPFEDTPDQEEAARWIKKDMESSKPMDRLICGDVGYGKTELAMRAAFKTVDHGKQVAVLVPTTVLAQQHYQTFTERVSDYPITVELLSRFRSRKEQKEVLERTREGLVDILIGTHRLVQRDVAFRDLGLVIIDEEQRFGVEHKNRLKRLKRTVDVLTLTATPIPRTLQMALLGLREISSLETPPEGRLAVRTEIIPFSEDRIRESILQELYRGGQVYFVHNRVFSIERVREKLEKLVPEARIAVVHGQMLERLIENRMIDFIQGRIDVLLTTTIIESGLDITNVNTIIINDSQTFGLAELHQLRGRVGRYKRRAFACLIVPPEKILSTVARKRLKAIVEYSHLGSGFDIAMKDLEIRGAGNILGPEQHGHIAAVGYDMYCRLLERAVKRLKDEEVPEESEVALSLGLDACIPDSYISFHRERMEMYRKITRIVDEESAMRLEEELRDRFGPPPQKVRQLILQARLKAAAMVLGIERIALSKRGMLVIRVPAGAELLKKLLEEKLTVRAIDSKTLYIFLPKELKKPEDIIEGLTRSLFSISSTGKGVAEGFSWE